MVVDLRKRNYPLKVTLLFFMLFSLLGCNKNFEDYWSDKSNKGGDLYVKIKSIPEFSMFAEALDHSGLAPFLVRGGSYSVFAPTNQAFSTFLNAKGYGSVKDVPAAQLFDLCSYHVVQSMWYYHTLRDRYINPNNNLYSKNMRYLTRSRKFVDIDVSVADRFQINGIDIIPSMKDIDADNGVIHGIPEVMAALPSLEELLNSDPELANSTFVKMLGVLKSRSIDLMNTFDKDKNGTIDTSYFVTYPLLNGGANIAVEYKTAGATVANSPGGTPAYTTLMIPNDQVLNAYIAPALAKVNNVIDSLSPSYIESVLENYVLVDTVMTSDRLKARTGTWLLSNNYEMLSTYLRNDTDFQRKDIRASNGIIHLINNVFRESPRQQSALGKAMVEPDFKLFFAAMQKANLVNTYGVNNRANSYLIPSNDAIRAARLDIEKQLLNDVFISATQLKNLLEHNIVNASLNKANLTGSRAAVFGGNLTFSNGGNTVTNTNGIVANVGPQLYSGTIVNTDYVYKTDKLLVPVILQ